MIDLRLGRWQDVLADVEPDAVICDPPYGQRTHAGYEEGEKRGQRTLDPLRYAAWTHRDVSELVTSWTPRTRRWIVAMTSHDLVPTWEAAYRDVGWLPFAPLPVLLPVRPRLQGDGPCSGPVWCVVARPRTRQAARWRATPAWYDVSDQRHHSPVIGGKPLGLMGALVRDYSEPGDLICDPCAGGATTLLAARDEGRRAVGAEVDPETYEAARERIDAGWTPRLF